MQCWWCRHAPSTLQKVRAVGQNIDQIIKPTAYPSREVLLTETSCTQKMGSLTEWLVRLMSLKLEHELCKKCSNTDGAGDSCSAHALLKQQDIFLRYTGRNASTISKMNSNFLHPLWTSSSAQGAGNYPMQVSKSTRKTPAVTPNIWRLHHWSRQKACGW